MTAFRAFAPRPCLVAALVLVLALSGLGRGWAAPVLDGGTVIGGVVVPICHGDHDDGTDPAGSRSHDCCDACALCAPVTLPGMPDLTAPSRVHHVVTHEAALGWAPVLVRPRTPRLSQGPPLP